jgi:hypothetical protein
MNLETIFEFIKEKRGYEYPVIYKLLNGLPLTDDELNIEGIAVDLRHSDITSLPDNLKISRDLSLYHSKIESLPNNLRVGKYLDLRDTKISSIPNNLIVGDGIFIHRTPLSKRYSIKVINDMIVDKGGDFTNIFM